MLRRRSMCKTTHFYPRPPRGGRHVLGPQSPPLKTISTHALREEGDALATDTALMAPVFLPTPSARRATSPIRTPPAPRQYFYPRPPRGGRPLCHLPNAFPDLHFYPRPPRGGRLYNESWVMVYDIFLPTPSARRATNNTQQIAENAGFLPTPSARRATALATDTALMAPVFLPTPSARRATYVSLDFFKRHSLFLPTPSARRATK